MQEESESTLSLGSTKPGPEVAPPPGFKEFVACLVRDSLSPAPIEASPETRLPDAMTEPVVATMYATQIVQNEATGVTYMDTMSALVGRVALRNPHMMANLKGPTVEDITDLT